MTGYFDALIRSTGVAFDSRPPAPGHHASPARAESTGPVGTDSLEIDLEGIAAPAAASTAGFPRHATPMRGPAGTAERPLERAPYSASPKAVEDTAAEVPPPILPARPAPPPAPLAEAHASQHEPASPDRSNRMLRAAMEWVAAGPVRAAAPAAATPAAAPTPSALADRGLPAAVPRADRPIQVPPLDRPSLHRRPLDPAPVDAAEPRARPAPSREAPSITVTAAVAPRADPIPAEPVTQQSAGYAPRVAHDEIIEVSIGAIHLRVDAPAVQMRPPPASPSPTRASTVSPYSRDGLRRRALRRI
jgi:hypothetical protein